jgi:hypothetical protein
LTPYAGVALVLDILVSAAVIAPMALQNVNDCRGWIFLAVTIALVCFAVIVRDPRVDDWMEGRTPVGSLEQ